MSPHHWELPEGTRYRERPYDYGKVWWSLRMAQLGYTALYLDNDVAVLTDPITPAYVGSPYDIQARADQEPRAAARNARPARARTSIFLHHRPGLDTVSHRSHGSPYGSGLRRRLTWAFTSMAQGLSDFRKAELPKLGGMLGDRCPLYRLKKDDSVPGGEVACQSWSAAAALTKPLRKGPLVERHLSLRHSSA